MVKLKSLLMETLSGVLRSTIAPKLHFGLAMPLLVQRQAFGFLPPNRRVWCLLITMNQLLILFLKGI